MPQSELSQLIEGGTMSFSFGVACFSFGYVREVPYSFSPSDYREAVESALSSMPSVTGISVVVDDFSGSSVVTEAPIPMQDGYGLPYPSDTSISFSVYIPHRVQEELGRTINHQSRMSCENFRVEIIDGYEGPVAFVECVGGGRENDPAMSVFLVREYLRKHLADHKGAAVFDYMGPSPFHGHFHLDHGVGAVDAEFKLTVKSSKGYGSYIFEVGGSSVGYVELSRLYSVISSELALYYWLIRRRTSLLEVSSKYESAWALARTSVDSAGISSLWGTAARHRSIRALISDGYALQAELAVGLSEMKHAVNEEYGSGVQSYFERNLRKVVEQFPQVSVDPILRWAEHVESASYKKLEIIAVLVASIVGGLVGAAITAAVS
ncbi:hypothetical protein [Stenotrophomonas sp.]|uniref:hypothetical protein n=1 Tax=Stenotrophomonas sp. TaxID=69392 RepID=UPI0033402C48